MLRRLATFVLFSLISGCSSNGVDGPSDVATPANGVLLSLSVPGRCLVGGCDPVDAEFSHLGLITLTNTGAQSAYVPLCGTLPALGTQQFVNGEWINVGPAISCAFGPRSKVIAPHDSLQLNSFYAIGIWRVSVGVATDTALVTEALSTSAPITVK